jgi:glycolate oxidase iron-sulfur subunit
MEAVKAGSLELDDAAAEHLDRCLGCLACETACPSGVSFHERIEEFRPRLPLAPASRAWRAIVAATSASPLLLRAALAVSRTMDAARLERVRRGLPALALLPRGTADDEWHTFTRVNVARPERPRLRVALLSGCAAAVLKPEIELAARQVLYRNGIDVVEAPGQTCCGALALHAGRMEEARELARRNSAVFAASGIDFVVTTAAGCGAMLKDYRRVLARDAHSAAAAAVTAKARDVSEVLRETGIAPPARPLQLGGDVAYHDACHLVHAARIAAEPRALVEAAIGKMPVDLGENQICCGSAGSYNLDRPGVARVLGRRKAELARERGVAAVAVGNIGCMLQMEQAFASHGLRVPVLHPVELLAEAYALSDR